MGPLNSAVGFEFNHDEFATLQLDAEGEPPYVPTTPLFTELMETSEPFDSRAIFFPLLLYPCPPEMPGPLMINPNLSL